MLAPAPPSIDPGRAALIVIDMQNGFCRADGSLARMGLDTAPLAGAIAPCAHLLAAARRAGLPVFHTRYVYAPDHGDGGLLVERLMPGLKAERALIAGGADAEIVPELAPAAGEAVIDKNRPSAFFRTELEAMLTERAIGQLILCGVTTNCCVEATVRDASQRDIMPFVVADATAELDGPRHSAALTTIGLLFGWITDVAAVEAALAEPR